MADYIRSLDQAKEREERARLLYVAVTRARERVVLWGHGARSQAGDPVPARRSLLESLWPAVRELYHEAREEPEGRAAVDAPPARPLRRLPLSWRLPEPAPAVSAAAATGAPEGEPGPEFDWAGDVARHVGTITHRVLERVAGEGLAAWPPTRVRDVAPAVRAQLAARGVGVGELEAASERVLAGVRATLEDPRGRWILAPREGARSEFGLTMATGEGARARSVDRTFVDEEGSRWIVDFKTGSHEGGRAEAFLDAEVGRYREQLVTYATYLRALDPGRRVRAALYYPLLRAFREVPV